MACLELGLVDKGLDGEVIVHGLVLKTMVRWQNRSVHQALRFVVEVVETTSVCGLAGVDMLIQGPESRRIWRQHKVHSLFAI